MNRSSGSLLHRLLTASIMLALSVWLISLTVAALQPLIPFLVVVGFVVGGIYVGALAIKRRRYW